MPLTGLDDYLASPKHPIEWWKSGARTTVAAIPFSLFDVAGSPGAGTLAVGNTANGLVHTDATPGYPEIPPLTEEGLLTIVDFGWNVAGRLLLFDRLFGAGAYAFNADVTLATQPSFAGRVPGLDYRGLELWIETVTAFTGNPSFQINYLNDAGVAGDTGVVGSGAAMTVGRMFRMPLQAGHRGVQRLDRVRCTIASAGTFNVWIMRRLWRGRVRSVNDGDVHNMMRTGARRVYTDSALFVAVLTDGTASGVPELMFEVCDT